MIFSSDEMCVVVCSDSLSVLNLIPPLHSACRLLSILASTEKDLANYHKTDRELTIARDAIQSLERKLTALQLNYSSMEKELQDTTNELTTSRADYLLMSQDLEQRNLECINLKLAIENMQKTQESNYKKLSENLMKQLHEQPVLFDEKMVAKDEEWKQELAKQNDVKVELEQRLSDESLLRRKAEIDMSTEKRRMQRTLEQALTQLQNVQKDVVDRVLISNLLVSYFQRKRCVII